MTDSLQLSRQNGRHPHAPVMPERSTWRVGRKVGRTIYALTHATPSDDDTLIGVMDTSELAQAAVWAHNAALGSPAFDEKQQG